jgi:glycine/D-amino acid oxidase-like deaminating enzyme
MRRESRKPHPWGTPPWTIDFRPGRKPLPLRADFAIVGAGFTGLSAAAWLAKLAPEKTVAVLESELIGNGASGRTGGMALGETAAGPLPGLGDVLAGYRKIMRAFQIDSRLVLPGAWELGRSKTKKDSAIAWEDAGTLGVVREVPGGTVDPGRVLSGLARAAQGMGVQIVERAEVVSLTSRKERVARRSPVGDALPGDIALRIRLKRGHRSQWKTLRAGKVLLATNAGSLNLSSTGSYAEPKLTLALATAPLDAGQLRSLGLSSRRPFYTIDLPYLWGRVLENNTVIFGAGLVPLPTNAGSIFTKVNSRRRQRSGFRDLMRFNVSSGVTKQRFGWLESRIRNMHPALKNVRITHRWGGPILITRDFLPIFRRHPHNKNVMVLGGFSGHGVALSVYLGHRAALTLLGRGDFLLGPRVR